MPAVAPEPILDVVRGLSTVGGWVGQACGRMGLGWASASRQQESAWE